MACRTRCRSAPFLVLRAVPWRRILSYASLPCRRNGLRAWRPARLRECASCGWRRSCKGVPTGSARTPRATLRDVRAPAVWRNFRAQTCVWYQVFAQRCSPTSWASTRNGSPRSRQPATAAMSQKQQQPSARISSSQQPAASSQPAAAAAITAAITAIAEHLAVFVRLSLPLMPCLSGETAGSSIIMTLSSLTSPHLTFP